jgi:hypothetical protein
MTDEPLASASRDRERLIEAIAAVLARHGIPKGSASVSLRSYGGADTAQPALLVFVRLNTWQPEALLAGPLIERRVRDTLYKALRVRIGYLFWRVGSDVPTPHDAAERFHARPATERLAQLARDAESAGALPRADAPLTDWSDFDESAG